MIDFKRQCKMVVMHPKEEIMSDNGIGDVFTGLPMSEIIGKLPDDLGEPEVSVSAGMKRQTDVGMKGQHRVGK